MVPSPRLRGGSLERQDLLNTQNRPGIQLPPLPHISLRAYVFLPLFFTWLRNGVAAGRFSSSLHSADTPRPPFTEPGGPFSFLARVRDIEVYPLSFPVQNSTRFLTAQWKDSCFLGQVSPYQFCSSEPLASGQILPPGNGVLFTPLGATSLPNFPFFWVFFWFVGGWWGGWGGEVFLWWFFFGFFCWGFLGLGG